MFSNIGVPGLIMILVLALIIFGPKKLPELGRAAGQTLREFKRSTQGLIEDEKETIVKAVKLEEEKETIVKAVKLEEEKETIVEAIKLEKEPKSN